MAAFEQETDDLSDLEGEPDELVQVPAGEDSAKGRNYTDIENMTVLRQWGMRKQHLVGKQAQRNKQLQMNTWKVIAANFLQIHKCLEGRIGVAVVLAQSAGFIQAAPSQSDMPRALLSAQLCVQAVARVAF